MRAIMLAFACKLQYHVLRATAAAGYSVHVLGQGCAQGLKHSRFCSSYNTFEFDPLSQSLDDAHEEISRWARNLSADIILPSDIVSTRLLAALSGRLSVPTCALPDPAVFDMLNDKWQFYKFCKSHGVKVPQTWLFEDIGQLTDAINEGSVPFPFIVKQHDSMGGSGVVKINDKADAKLLDTVKYKPLLVQKLVVGEDIDIACIAYRGRIGAYAIKRYLPKKYVFVQHAPLLAEASRIIAASGFHGIAHFDAVREESTGDVYLLECNPRVWMSIFSCIVAGMNFVKMNLDPALLDFDNPPHIVGSEVDSQSSTVQLLAKLITEHNTNKSADYNLLKYNLADPVGKKYITQTRFDDGILASGSPGSIGHQTAFLARLSGLEKRVSTQL